MSKDLFSQLREARAAEDEILDAQADADIIELESRMASTVETTLEKRPSQEPTVHQDLKAPDDDSQMRSLNSHSFKQSVQSLPDAGITPGRVTVSFSLHKDDGQEDDGVVATATPSALEDYAEFRQRYSHLSKLLKGYLKQLDPLSVNTDAGLAIFGLRKPPWMPVITWNLEQGGLVHEHNNTLEVEFDKDASLSSLAQFIVTRARAQNSPSITVAGDNDLIEQINLCAKLVGITVKTHALSQEAMEEFDDEVPIMDLTDQAAPAHPSSPGLSVC